MKRIFWLRVRRRAVGVFRPEREVRNARDACDSAEEHTRARYTLTGFRSVERLPAQAAEASTGTRSYGATNITQSGANFGGELDGNIAVQQCLAR